MSEQVTTNLLGRHVTWYVDGRQDGGSVVAVTFFQGGFMLLVHTDRGLIQKIASGVSVE